MRSSRLHHKKTAPKRGKIYSGGSFGKLKISSLPSLLTKQNRKILVQKILAESQKRTLRREDWSDFLPQVIDFRSLKTFRPLQIQIKPTSVSLYPTALMEKYHLLTDKKLRRTITDIEKMELADVRNEIATIDARSKKADIWQDQSLKLRQELAQIRAEVEALPDVITPSK